jgi:hypothetical protein
MSRTGASGGYMVSATTSGVAVNTWAFHFWAKGSTAPGTAITTQPFTSQGGATNPDFGFSWDHAAAAFKQAVYNRRASGAYDAAQLTSTLAANTWYAIGGSFDGTNLKAYLNGTLEATVASATSANVACTQSILAATAGGSKWANGTMGEVAMWFGNPLTDDIFKALANRMTPEMIVPGASWLGDYWPLWGFSSPEGTFSTSIAHRDMNLTGTCPRGDEPPVSPGVGMGPCW